MHGFLPWQFMLKDRGNRGLLEWSGPYYQIPHVFLPIMVKFEVFVTTLSEVVVRWNFGLELSSPASCDVGNLKKETYALLA